MSDHSVSSKQSDHRDYESSNRLPRRRIPQRADGADDPDVDSLTETMGRATIHSRRKNNTEDQDANQKDVRNFFRDTVLTDMRDTLHEQDYIRQKFDFEGNSEFGRSLLKNALENASSRTIISRNNREPMGNHSRDNIEWFYRQKTFENQRSFGKKIIDAFRDPSILNVMALAPTQSGKTGSMLACIYEFMRDPDLWVPYQNICIFTPLSSLHWIQQTKKRFPSYFAPQIFHRNRFMDLVQMLSEKRNVLIFMDEIQIASGVKQTSYHMFRMLELFDVKMLYERDIKIITFTATPVNLKYHMSSWKNAFRIIQMDVPENYISHQKLMEDGRIMQAKDLCGWNERTRRIDPSVLDNIRELEQYLGRIPKNHIIRTGKGLKHSVTIRNFKKVFRGRNYEFYSEPNDIDDLDVFMKYPPENHTFIFILDKLTCAKTIKHKYVGILYERHVPNQKVHTTIQGLAGRLTGYHNNKNAVVFTHVNNIKKYYQTEHEADQREIAKFTKSFLKPV